jgi:hypothetical protein
MIVRNGTGLRRAFKVFLVRNWGLILTVVLTEQAIVIISGTRECSKPTCSR